MCKPPKWKGKKRSLELRAEISIVQVRGGLHTTEVILTPRYPLFGGWKAEFTLGYSLPLEVCSIFQATPKKGHNGCFWTSVYGGGRARGGGVGGGGGLLQSDVWGCLS